MSDEKIHIFRSSNWKKVDWSFNLSPVTKWTWHYCGWYWNSIRSWSISNEYQEQPPKIIAKFPRRELCLWGESVISKLLTSLWSEFFPQSCLNIVTTFVFVLKFQQKNLHGQKSTVWKTALIPHYLNLLTRMSSVIFSCPTQR